ncbi:uncharacterized protein B0P05DRAFT_479804 [Gilbertella persicaria]|uniref:uncharacterized protein n=1 Tax=Gilbertella persicaria TaxID=101096 RepID=UPI00222011C2|nr:uncharacterized protein B0P05DRAFT_479804 [Gilbertella persicaria]KAI8053157.1 hypothetical protein B0P05DRAFT_479804 [Gilbertella persicaria]
MANTRSRKRRDTEKNDIPRKKSKGKQKIEETVIDSTDDEYDNEEFMTIDLPPTEEEDRIDWEHIDLPPRFEDMPNEDKPVYNDVEIVMEAPRPVLKKSNWERAYQRNLREWMHHSHVVLLVAHYKLRNRWCSHSDMKSVCLSIIPDHAKRLLKKDKTESALKTGIKWLIGWWSDYFRLTGPGLLTVPYSEAIRKDITIRQWIDQEQSDEYGDCIKDIEAFLHLLSRKSATRDTSAELFVGILRACGCDTRLVCSLQPIPYKIAPETTKKGEPTEKEEEEKEEEKTKTLFPFRPRSRTYVDPSKELCHPRAKPPCVWAEVWCPDTKRWMCIDMIRGHIDKPGLMEPAALNRSNCMSFVLAFSNDNKNVVDVTRRYTSNLERAIRLRERPLTKREKEGGMKLWSDIFLSCLIQKHDERDNEEQAFLEELETREIMPTSINAFKNHSLYALERHLKKYEVLHPKEPVLGSIRGEKIYPRSCVKTVNTADAYRKKGREIKEGEQPVKMVKANAMTIEKRRLKEQAKQDGQELLVACYGEWQTQPYCPPPVVNGKLVKNAYGSIDLFTPEMLPQGAAHIPIKGIAKMAKKLNIDYADAIVDFDFVKMRAVPVVDGIVVAEENKYILLEAWEEHEQSEAVKAIAKKEEEVYKNWRKLIKGLLIKARVDQTYGKSEERGEDKWDKFNGERSIEPNHDFGGGGFLPEDD